MNWANRITLARIFLVPVFVGCLVYWTPQRSLQRIALWIFLLACFTDALDGYLSRRFCQKTRLGTLIDPLADKILLTTTMLGLAFLPNLPLEVRIPAWLAILVVSRDLILIAGAFVIFAIRGHFEPNTNFLGKMTTFFQMVLILQVLLDASGIHEKLFLWFTGALTLVSGLVYLKNGLDLLSNGRSSHES